MTHGYDKVYLEKARTVLGRMLDFAVHELRWDIDEFFSLFLSSGIAARFEQGDFTILAGKSGVEAAYEVLEKAGVSAQRKSPSYAVGRSPEYWLGWALAYYQWAFGLSFEEIVSAIPVKEILALYTPYHEMDIRQFCDKMNDLYKAARPEINLKRLRQNAGLSQKDLAELSGVPLRTIQQYEQRQKNINKAQAETLVLLSRALYCGVEDLMEKVE